MICNEKIALFQNLLKEKEIDAAVFLYCVEFFYFTGTIQGNLLVIPKEGEASFFVRRAFDRAVKEAECSSVLAIKSFKEAAPLLKDAKKVGFIFESIPVSVFNKTVQSLGLSSDKVVDLSLDFRHLKMVKSEDEIAKIKSAGKIIEKTYDALPNLIKAGMSEHEVSVEIERLLRLNGHSGMNRFHSYNQFALPSYALTAESINIPAVHDTPYAGTGTSKAIGVGGGFRKLQKGNTLMVDTVSNFEGYHNDIARTFSIGKPSDRIQEAYEMMKEIYFFVESKLQVGTTCEQVYQDTLAKVKELGLENNFMGLGKNRLGFIGHGIGVEIDEFPVFANRFGIELKEGMTVALEPKLYFEDIGGVGLESVFAIRKDGAENLSFPVKDILVID